MFSDADKDVECGVEWTGKTFNILSENIVKVFQ